VVPPPSRRRLVRSLCGKTLAIHFHNYTAKQSYKRCYGDSFALAATSPIPVRNFDYHYTVALGTAKDAAKDRRWRAAQCRRLEWPRALLVRLAQRLGKRDGDRAGWKHFARDTPATR